mmetsp:Transcript_35323/g.48236  ORF Transcript_35323/g.48236 Transcript_35323/m.48236 type:complete len:263 (+) Transcript_35323:97-885(+)
MWTVLDGEVYDVTNFMKEHPGGEEPFREAAGEEAAEIFASAGHGDFHKEQLEQYRIGRIKEESEEKEGEKGDEKAEEKEDEKLEVAEEAEEVEEAEKGDHKEEKVPTLSELARAAVKSTPEPEKETPETPETPAPESPAPESPPKTPAPENKPKVLRELTMEEIAKHNKPEDLWVVIHNNVYDVTAYQRDHPGGEDILVEAGGTDASEDFDEVGHSKMAKKEMQRYHIGVVRPSESSFNWGLLFLGLGAVAVGYLVWRRSQK